MELSVGPERQEGGLPPCCIPCSGQMWVPVEKLVPVGPQDQRQEPRIPPGEVGRSQMSPWGWEVMWIHGCQASSQQVEAREMGKGTPTGLAMEDQGFLWLPATLLPPLCLPVATPGKIPLVLPTREMLSLAR